MEGSWVLGAGQKLEQRKSSSETKQLLQISLSDYSLPLLIIYPEYVVNGVVNTA